MSDEGFKAGSAYIDLEIRDKTGPGKDKAKEDIEGSPPAKLPVVADNPIDEAWRAKLKAALKATAADALKIPMTPDTAELRANTAAAVAELSKTLKAKVPADLSEADKFKAEAEALAKTVSETVKAKIPAEIDPDKGKPEAEKAGTEIAKSFSGAFGNGIAPMPAVIGAALLAGAPLIGAAMIGIAGVGMAAAATAIASGTPAVMSRWEALGNSISDQTEALRPRLEAPIVDALDVIRDRFDKVAPLISNSLISAESAVRPLTDGLLGLVQGALPGLSLAIANQGPVMQGFKSLLIDTGKAVGDTFEGLSQHSKAFGVDTASLGAIVRSAMTLITNVVNQAGEAWASNSGQITGAVGQLMGGLGQLSGSVIPALASELANVLSVLGFFAQALGTVEHALGPMAGEITALALSAKLLGVNLTAIPGMLGQLPGKLAEVAEGGGKFAGVSGALAGVLPAVGTGLGVVAAGFGLVALGASTAAAHEQDLIDAGTALGHSIIIGGTAASDAAKKLNDMEDSTNKLKGQIASLSGQTNAGTTAVNEYGGGYSVTASKSQELQGKLQDLNIQLKAATDAENDYKKELGPLGVAQAQAAQAQKDYNDAVTQSGPSSAAAESASKKLATANAAVTSQQQNLNNAMSLTKASLSTFEKPAAQLQADLGKIGDAASTDSEKITAMKDALIRLSGGKIPVGDAMESIDKVMSEINAQMATGIKAADGYGKAILNADGSIRTVTKNGQYLRDAMGDLRSKFVDAAAAIVAEDESQGKSADSAKAHAQAVLEEQIPAVEKLGGAMGLTKDQVDAALKSMGAWPADLVTVVATPGVEQAQQAMDILKGKVLDVPNDHTVHTSALTDAAIQSLRDLGLVVTTLPDGTVTITGNTDLARSAANTLIRDINGMRAVVTISASGSVDSLHVVGSRVTANAAGNMLVPMADGGFGGRQLTAMSSASAQMVPPNSWRVVGDNMAHTELYAPLDGSQRSASLIAQAAQHEKISVGGQRAVTINQTVITSDPQQAADRAAGAVAWAMSSARG